MKNKFQIFPIKVSAKVATALLDKVQSALGLPKDPQRMKDVAAAKAESLLIKANAKGEEALINEANKHKKKVKKLENRTELEELKLRTKNRVLATEVRNQQNLESIAKRSIPLLDNNANPEELDDDWIVNMLNRSKIFADELMQELFARILAGEANSPGSFSKKSVNLLAEIEKKDAICFKSLCRFNWNLADRTVPLVFDHNHEIYQKNGINYETLKHLEGLGLLQHSVTEIILAKALTGMKKVSYQGSILVLEAPGNSAYDLSLGHVILTATGLELCRLFENEPVEGIFEYVKGEWKELISKTWELNMVPQP